MSDENKKLGLLTLRNFRDIIILSLIVVVTWKLIDADLSISIKEFTFTDLLSLFMAIFAIALSVAFYFKATDTSNKFYDNSYKFTKEISEILGRIEAGFGEKLKHIDEGYTGIRDRFDQLPFNEAKAKEEVEAEKQEIEVKTKEQTDLFESLAQKAQLAETEKNALFEKMANTNKELERAKLDLRKMERNIFEHRASNEPPEKRRKAMRYLAEKIDDEIPPGLEGKFSISMMRKIFSSIKDDLYPEAIDDLLSTGIIDDDGELTKRGIQDLRLRLRKR